MILGVGIDLVEVERIERSIARFGDRFLQRILVKAEADYCLSHRQPAQHVAARFAAKEAISKAFGTGIGRSLSWQDLEIGRESSGRPTVILHRAGLERLAQQGGRAVHVSLSHTARYACAVAVLEAADPI